MKVSNSVVVIVPWEDEAKTKFTQFANGHDYSTWPFVASSKEMIIGSTYAMILNSDDILHLTLAVPDIKIYKMSEFNKQFNCSVINPL